MHAASRERVPLGERVGARRGKALEAVQLEEVAGLRQPLDLVAPPLGLSVCVALNDQLPGKRTNIKAQLNQSHIYCETTFMAFPSAILLRFLLKTLLWFYIPV